MLGESQNGLQSLKVWYLSEDGENVLRDAIRFLPAVCQRAEYPFHQCLSGSARNCLHSSGEEAGIRIFGKGWSLLEKGLRFGDDYQVSGHRRYSMDPSAHPSWQIGRGR